MSAAGHACGWNLVPALFGSIVALCAPGAHRPSAGARTSSAQLTTPGGNSCPGLGCSWTRSTAVTPGVERSAPSSGDGTDGTDVDGRPDGLNRKKSLTRVAPSAAVVRAPPL